MARRSSLAARVGLASLAVLAIIAMHGSAADAHACDAGTTHPTPGHRVHAPDHHDAEGAGESPSPHCGPVACSAIVTSSPVLVPGSNAAGTPLPAMPHQPMTGTPWAPDPPVPRLLLSR